MDTTGQTPTNPYADMAELPPPIFSTMTNALPKTFAALLGEYQRNGHGRYKDIKGRKTNWSNGQKNALHKRLYLYEQIAREAHAMGSRNGPYRNKTLQVRLEAAAAALDLKYKNKNKSLDQTMKEIKATDSSVKSRKRRSNELSTDEPVSP